MLYYSGLSLLTSLSEDQALKLLIVTSLVYFPIQDSVYSSSLMEDQLLKLTTVLDILF